MLEQTRSRPTVGVQAETMVEEIDEGWIGRRRHLRQQISAGRPFAVGQRSQYRAETVNIVSSTVLPRPGDQRPLLFRQLRARAETIGQIEQPISKET